MSVKKKGAVLGDSGAARVAAFILAGEGTHPITQLNISDNELQLQGVVALARALGSDACALRSLNISRSALTDTAAEAFAGALACNATLTELSAQGCGLGPLGCEALVEGLTDNTSLVRLNLRANNVGDRGAAAVAGWLKAGGALKALNIAHNELGE